jgi:very-short-patch-repair endonuclease
VIEESKTTPLTPLDRGGRKAPSPAKGRAGEGLPLEVLTKRGVLPYNKNLTECARENRKNPTKAESKIWNEVLRMRQFAEYKFLRQKPIDNYIVDFYCSELCLVIEIDGDSHAEAIEYDAERTNILESLGLTVVRYTNNEVLRNIEGVYDDLSHRLTPLAPLDRGELKGSPLSRGAGRGLLLIPSEKRAGEGFE